MALCLAESLITCEEFSLRDQLERYCRWYRDGYFSSTGECFDICETTEEALHNFEATGEIYSGPTDRQSVGNGSLMRLAPVPMRYVTSPRDAIAFAAESSRATHGAREAVDACRYFSALMVGALEGASKDDLLAPFFEPVSSIWENEPLAPAIRKVASGSFKDKPREKIKSGGNVVESLEAALWSFQNSRSFEEGALLAVNLGGAADSTGAIYGQLAGAFYGVGEIPSRWLSKLFDREMIEEMATRLHACA